MTFGWRTLAGVRLAVLMALAVATGAATAFRPSPAVPRFSRSVDGIPITDSTGAPYHFPFLGGLDRPRPQLIDIDGDGDLDLFVQEYTGSVMFFERTDSGYTWRTDDYQGLQVGEWNRFVDIDGDGDMDLLAESPFSYIRYYRNDGNRTSPHFVLAADTLRDANGELLYADRQNIPQVADLDCNGKLDLMLGRVDGSITRYELQRLTPDGVPVFGFVTENFQDIKIIGQGQVQPTMHGANTMYLTDLDGDGDLDILWGDFFEPGLLWIPNNGNCGTPSMHDTPIPFPENAPVRTSGYNAPYGGDLDGDGDQDFVMGVLGGAFDPTLTSRDNLYVLTQTGRNTWVVTTKRLLDGLDVGSESQVALADLDGDGDLDMLVGNKIEPGNSRTADLYYLRNVGSVTAPAFHLVGQVPIEPGYHYAPALGDLDGDGRPDLLMGTWRDALRLYRNEGDSTGPRFVLADSAFVRLTRGSHAVPALGDLDGDGDLDLIVGEGSGTLNYYRNDGSRTAPSFVLVSDAYDSISVGRRSAPTLVDIDGDGDLDLLVGNEAGELHLFLNEGTKRTPRFRHADAFTMTVAAYASPAGADIDGDGRPELFMGTGSGGVEFWRTMSR